MTAEHRPLPQHPVHIYPTELSTTDKVAQLAPLLPKKTLIESFAYGNDAVMIKMQNGDSFHEKLENIKATYFIDKYERKLIKLIDSKKNAISLTILDEAFTLEDQELLFAILQPKYSNRNNYFNWGLKLTLPAILFLGLQTGSLIVLQAIYYSFFAFAAGILFGHLLNPNHIVSFIFVVLGVALGYWYGGLAAIGTLIGLIIGKTVNSDSPFSIT